MEIQRSEGTFKDDFELDTSQITKLAHTAATCDLQPSQADQPLRKKPSWMKATRVPDSASQPSGRPPRNSSDLETFAFAAEQGARGNNGGGTPQLHNRVPGDNGFNSQQQQQTAAPLQPQNGRPSTGEWQPAWKQKPQQEHTIVHRYSTSL